MKHFRIIILTAVAAMASALLGACSADEPTFNPENPTLPDADYSSRSFAELVDPGSESILTRSDVKSYQKDDQTNGGWEEYDYREYFGGGIPAPRLIVVKNGKLYTEMALFSCACGPTHFSTALGLLMKTGAVKRDSEILINRDYNIEANIIKACGTSLNVKNIKDGNMWLTTIEDYYGGRTGNGGQHLYVMTYNIDGAYKDNYYRFDTIEEAYAWLIENFRTRFGEEVNLNEYTDNMIIYDYPIFNVAMIEYELQQYLAGGLIL